MTIYKLLSVLISFVFLILLALLLSGAIGALDRGPRAATVAKLDAGAVTLAAAVNGGGAGLLEIAGEFAGIRDVGLGFDRFVRAVNTVRPNSDPTTMQQNRIDRASEKLDEQREMFRDAHGTITGVALVNDVGVVMNTDTAVFAPLANVVIPTPKPIVNEDGEEVTFIDNVLAGQGATALLVSDGSIYHVGAAPLAHPIRKKIIGAVLVVRKLLELPVTPGVSAVLIVDGKVALGETPDGFAEPEQEPPTDGAFLLMPADPQAEVGDWFTSGFPSFLGSDNDRPGLWAERYAVAGTDAARGYVFSDLGPAYARLRGAQLLSLLLAMVVWLVHVVLVVFDGWRLRAGVTALARFLDDVHHGQTEARAVDEGTLPRGLRRLGKLVNQSLQHYVGGGDVKPLPAAPSVDDVLDVQNVADGDTDRIADFAFEGISNSGTLDIADLQDGGMKPPPPPSDIGEDDDGYDDSVAQAGEDLFAGIGDDDSDIEIPAVAGDDADAALDHLERDAGDAAPPLEAGDADAEEMIEELESIEEEEAAADADARRDTDSVAVAVEELAASEAGGETDPDAGAPAFKPFPNVPVGGPTDESAVMKVTPEVIEQMKATAETKAKAAAAKKKATAARKPAIKPPPPPKDESDGAAEVMKVTPELLEQMARAGNPRVPATASQSAGADTSDHFREVFDAFVATRKECGESGELSFEKFRKRLEQSKAAVIQKHHCPDVRFQVHVKNGKAALKATPTR